MKNKINKYLKNLISIFIIIGFIMDSFAVAVADNDGAAFITKAEFDSLKNNFQTQLDIYNTSIDNKIDDAISQYLAGLKVETKTNIDSILYKANEYKTITFSKNWTVPTTQIGDKRVVTSMFWWVFNTVAYNSTASRYFSIPIGVMVANKTTANITETTLGSSATVIAQPGYNATYSKYYIDNESFWNILPKSSVTHFVWHDSVNKNEFWFNINDKANVYCEIEDLGTLENRNHDFGTKQYQADVYIKGGASGDYTYGNQPATYITQTTDTFMNISSIPDSKYINILAGNQVSGTLKTTKIEDWNTTESTAMATYDCNTGYGWKSAGNYYSTTKPIYDGIKWSLSSWPTKLPKMEIYLKKNTDMQATDLIHNGISSAVDKKITYFSGIPIFTATSDGIIELPLVFTLAESGGANFSIRNSEFSNSSTLPSSTVTMYTDKELTVPYTSASFSGKTSYEVKLYFNVKKNETYWIKVKPTTDNDVSVNTKEESIILYSNNK